MSDFITIPLSKTGKYAGMYEAIISLEDADLAELNWSVRSVARNNYAYKHPNEIDRHLHRIVLARILGRKLHKDESVDHINGNGLDNQRHNLRLATAKQNSRNKRLSKSSTSGFKGVTWSKQMQKWKGSITVDGKHIHLGYFLTKRRAHNAYCEAAKKYHKHFKNLGDN